MQQFVYTIRDPLGIHARPAGMLAKIAKTFPNVAITIIQNDESVKATQILKLMGLGIRQGDEVMIRAEGPSEDEAIAELQKFFSENL